MFEFNKKSGADAGPDQTAREPQSAAPAVTASESRPTPAAAPRPAPAGQATGRREAAVIGPTIHMDGQLHGEEDLYVEGQVSGTIHLENNTLTIGSQGKVMANVYAHTVYVDGTMEGDLYGAEQVIVRKNARVRGNITSPRVSLEDGATFKGSIEMDPEAVKAAIKPAASRTAAGRPQQNAAPGITGGIGSGKPGVSVAGGSSH